MDVKPGDKKPQEKEKDEEKKPFELNNFQFKAPKGAFVRIVGGVGSEKVTFLNSRCPFFTH